MSNPVAPCCMSNFEESLRYIDMKPSNLAGKKNATMIPYPTLTLSISRSELVLISTFIGILGNASKTLSSSGM